MGWHLDSHIDPPLRKEQVGSGRLRHSTVVAWPFVKRFGSGQSQYANLRKLEVSMWRSRHVGTLTRIPIFPHDLKASYVRGDIGPNADIECTIPVIKVLAGALTTASSRQAATRSFTGDGRRS